jgi:DNA polymerase I-like protein with 3'-5' exonuclease and polymerase domains
MLFYMVQLQPQLDARNAFLVGTLHDAIFLQVREDSVDEVAPLVKEVMENLPLKKTFGLELSIPIEVDVDYDQHWTGTPDASGLGIEDNV